MMITGLFGATLLATVNAVCDYRNRVQVKEILCAGTYVQIWKPCGTLKYISKGKPVLCDQCKASSPKPKKGKKLRKTRFKRENYGCGAFVRDPRDQFRGNTCGEDSFTCLSCKLAEGPFSQMRDEIGNCGRNLCGEKQRNAQGQMMYLRCNRDEGNICARCKALQDKGKEMPLSPRAFNDEQAWEYLFDKLGDTISNQDVENPPKISKQDLENLRKVKELLAVNGSPLQQYLRIASNPDALRTMYNQNTELNEAWISVLNSPNSSEVTTSWTSVKKNLRSNLEKWKMAGLI